MTFEYFIDIENKFSFKIMLLVCFCFLFISIFGYYNKHNFPTDLIKINQDRKYIRDPQNLYAFVMGIIIYILVFILISIQLFVSIQVGYQIRIIKIIGLILLLVGWVLGIIYLAINERPLITESDTTDNLTQEYIDKVKEFITRNDIEMIVNNISLILAIILYYIDPLTTNHPYFLNAY